VQRAFHQDANHPEGASSSGNPAGTPPGDAASDEAIDDLEATKPSGSPRVPGRAGDRDRTGDVQLGKLAFYH
jgi:hypothetical protein